jgi:hypothetical protein
MKEEASKTEDKTQANYSPAKPSLAKGFLLFLGSAGGITGLIILALTVVCCVAGSLFL